MFVCCNLQPGFSVDIRPKSQQPEHKRHGISLVDPTSVGKSPEVLADWGPSLVPSDLFAGGRQEDLAEQAEPLG